MPMGSGCSIEFGDIIKDNKPIKSAKNKIAISLGKISLEESAVDFIEV